VHWGICFGVGSVGLVVSFVAKLLSPNLVGLGMGFNPETAPKENLLISNEKYVIQVQPGDVENK
jgi:hypothetical protein